ncbi:MAG: FYDLN acid domain-containing protein [Deltaproteobacteria bacterium]|nr:FYDLN acid domain-containing protein [Deltaproteobacteria bacterium]
MPKPKLGNKYACMSCGTKFYDLGKAHPSCPKCGWNPREAGAEARGGARRSAIDDGDGVLNLRSVLGDDDYEDDRDDEVAIGSDLGHLSDDDEVEDELDGFSEEGDEIFAADDSVGEDSSDER